MLGRMSALRIRPATSADVPLIRALIGELADYEKLRHEVVATEAALAAALFGERPAAEVLIAEVGPDQAGFALFFTSFSTFLGKPGIYLEDLFVRPAFRGQGVGRALLSKLAHLAAGRGCGRLEWSVLDWNHPAIGFYESLGAKPQNEWTVYRLSGPALTELGQS